MRSLPQDLQRQRDSSSDWNASLLFDSEGDDTRKVLEFANVELLEMRYLAQKMDRALDQAHETLSKRAWNLPRMLGSFSADLRRVAELQIDNAILFEGVNNALKLLGDQYLARVTDWSTHDSSGRLGQPAQAANRKHLRKNLRPGSQPARRPWWVIIILIAAEMSSGLCAELQAHNNIVQY
jgi:hypothetical protein